MASPKEREKVKATSFRLTAEQVELLGKLAVGMKKSRAWCIGEMIRVSAEKRGLLKKETKQC